MTLDWSIIHLLWDSVVLALPVSRVTFNGKRSVQNVNQLTHAKKAPCTSTPPRSGQETFLLSDCKISSCHKIGLKLDRQSKSYIIHWPKSFLYSNHYPCVNLLLKLTYHLMSKSCIKAFNHYLNIHLFQWQKSDGEFYLWLNLTENFSSEESVTITIFTNLKVLLKNQVTVWQRQKLERCFFSAKATVACVVDFHFPHRHS